MKREAPLYDTMRFMVIQSDLISWVDYSLKHILNDEYFESDSVRNQNQKHQRYNTLDI